MKASLEIENKASLNGADNLLGRLEEGLKTSESRVRELVIARLQALLAELPFLEASLRNPRPPYREIPPNRLLTLQETSKLLNISVRWIYRHTKKLPHRKIGHYTRFPERELLKWAERQQIRTP